MARWNHQPKYRIQRWDAYSYLQTQPNAVHSTLKHANEMNAQTFVRVMNAQAFVRLTIKHIQHMAAMFIPVKDMSPAVKTSITDHYKYAVFPTKVHLMQLDGKRAEVK